MLTLKVTPQITEAGTVILTVEVENNSADFANLVNGIPPINTQSAKTQVLVRDGATAVIGGIYQSNEQTSQQSTPFLGKRADPGLPVPEPVRAPAPTTSCSCSSRRASSRVERDDIADGTSSNEWRPSRGGRL